MRIALIAEWLDPWRGGAETSTLQFLHHLLDLGVEVHVFTRSRPSPSPSLHVHTVPGASMSRVRRSVTFAHRVERMLKSYLFDVVHAVTPVRGVDVYEPRGGTVAETIERNVNLRGKRASKALKRYAGRLNLKQRYLLAMEQRLFTDANGPVVIALSEYVRRQLKAHYALPDGRIRKVFNGVNTTVVSPEQAAKDRRAVRSEFRISDSQLLVLSVAHNFRLKGVHHWMEALSRLLKSGAVPIRSLVIGKGDTQAWHRLAGRLGITDALTFVGPSDRMAQLYRSGDLLVHPTHYDPCSRVVLEAMVSGLPCVTTRWDGAADVIEDGCNGYVLDDPADVSALADRVRRLGDREHRERLGAAARSAADRVSMRRHAEGVLAVYDEIRTAKLAKV